MKMDRESSSKPLAACQVLGARSLPEKWKDILKGEL